MTRRLPSIRNRAFLLLMGVSAAFLFAYWAALHLFVDPKAVQERFEAVFQEALYSADIMESELSVFPLPKIILRRLTVNNPAESSESYFLEAPEIHVHFNLLSLLSHTEAIGKIRLLQPSLVLERTASDTANWQPLMDHLSRLQSTTQINTVIENGTIFYQDHIAKKEESLTKLSGSLTLDQREGFSAELAFLFHKRQGRLSIVSGQGELRSFQQFRFQTTAELAFAKDMLRYSGVLSRQPGQTVTLQGNAMMRSMQPKFWLERLFISKAKEGAFSALPKDISLVLDATIDSRPDAGRISVNKLQLGKSNGQAQVAWKRADAKIQTETKFSFNQLDMDEILSSKDRNLNAFFSLLLPKGTDGKFTLTAQSFVYFTLPFRQLQIAADVNEAELTLNQATAQLPGKTRVFAFGILKRDVRQLISFDGSMELLGEDALALMRDSGLQRLNILPLSGKKFRARANLFLAADRATVSEMRFQGGDFYMVGGVNVNPGSAHDIEATLRFRNVRLEPLLAYFSPLFSRSAPTDAKILNRRLDWLAKVQRSALLNLLFEDFLLGNHKGVRSQFLVSLQKDKAYFQKIDLNLDHSHVQGKALFDQTAETPKVEAVLDISDYDLNPLLGTSLITQPVPRGNVASVWSAEPFETSFLRGYDSALDIRIAHASHASFSIDNLELKSTSQNGEWNIESLKGTVWGGQFAIAGSMDVTSVSRMNATLQMTNLRTEEALKSLAGFEGVRGLVSVSAEVGSSGVSPSDFIKNMSGTFAFSGREIIIRGFDLSSLVQTVPAVRSVADVVNTVRIATLQGASSFSLVDGGFYFSQGTLGTQGITFRSRHAIGAFGGTIDLMRWMLNAAIQFKLISIVSEEYPMVTVLFRDSMDNPIIDIDTRSLEAWVARRKLLQ